MAEAFRQAEQLVEDGQYEYAIFLLSDAIESDYERAEALCRRSACYMHLNKFRAASEDLARATSLDRTLTSAYVKQSKCYLALGDLRNAISALDALLQVEPGDSFAKYEKDTLKMLHEYDKQAKKHFEHQNYEEVIDLMNRCLERAEICIRFKLMKGECLIYLGRHTEALQIINDVLFLHKDDSEAICIRAMNLLYQGKYGLGLAELKEIISVSPRGTELFRTYKRLRDVLSGAEKALGKKNWEEAKTLYEIALRSDSRNRQLQKSVNVKLGEVLFKLKEYDAAIERCTEALELDKDLVGALKLRADCNFQLEDYEIAVEEYKQVIALQANAANKEKLRQAEIKLKMENDCYKILEVTKETSASDMKKAYYEMARKLHPDKHADKPEYIRHKFKVKFARLNNAYEELKQKHSIIN